MRLNLTSVCLSYLVDYLDRLPAEERTTKLDALIGQVIEPFARTGNEGVLAFEKLVLSKLASSSMSSESNREAFRRIRSNNLSYLPTSMTLVSLDNSAVRLAASFMRFCQLAAVRMRTTGLDDRKFTNLRRLLASNEYLKSYYRAFIKNCSDSGINNELLANYDENALVYQAVRLMFHLYNLEVFYCYLYD